MSGARAAATVAAQPGRPPLPARVRWYIALTVSAALLSLPASTLAPGVSHGTVAALDAVLLAAFIALGHRWLVHIGPQRKVSITTAPQVAAVLLLPGPLAVLTVALGAVGGEAQQAGVRPAQRLFNGAVAVLRAVVGVSLYAALLPLPPVARIEPLAAVVAAAGMYVLTTVLVRGIAAVQRRTPLLSRSLVPAPELVVAEVSLSLLGILAAVAAAAQPWALAFLGAPALLAQQAMRLSGALEQERDRRQQAAALRRALAREELVLHYQLEVDLATGEPIGVEALVRWQHPQRGLLPPAAFIPLAEESGLIVPLGRWVLREACRQARCWQEQLAAARPLLVGVNLSPQQLRQGDLVADVTAALRQHDLAPDCLQLEITESVLLEDVPRVARTLTDLRQLGVSLALDDFGTGYSALSYLWHFQVDTLKLDRSVVGALGEHAGSAAVVRAVTVLARELGMSVTAEGIETAQQRDHLRRLGCRRGQGYFFGKPIPAAALTTLLTDRAAARRRDGQPQPEPAHAHRGLLRVDPP